MNLHNSLIIRWSSYLNEFRLKLQDSNTALLLTSAIPRSRILLLSTNYFLFVFYLINIIDKSFSISAELLLYTISYKSHKHIFMSYFSYIFKILDIDKPYINKQNYKCINTYTTFVYLTVSRS